MNKRIFVLSLLLVLATTGFLSCKKVFDWKNVTPEPPVTGCDVAEYHLPYYDFDPLAFPFVFKKTYDATGKIVKEIDCSFWNLNTPQKVARNELILDRKAGSLFLLDKHNLSDTVLYVYFNSIGRVKSLRGTDKLINYEEKIRSNNFFYADNRLSAIETIITDGQGGETRFMYPVTYDSYGNVLSVRSNSYEYDYTRKAGQQFLIDDYMDYENGFYLMQYLGYFPELTNPPNIRVLVRSAALGTHSLASHSFDAANRLSAYNNNFGKVTISYNCK